VTFVDHLSRYTHADWVSAIETLALEIHPIDLHATRVWFALVAGTPLADRIETSHTFLYGHRYWPQVKRAILAAAKETSWPTVLPELLDRTADYATRTTQVDRDQLLGITAAALMTLSQVGLEAFAATSGTVQLPKWAHVRSVRQVRRARRHQGWRPFGALFGKPRFRVTYSEASPDASFNVAEGETIASGMPPGLRRCGTTCSGACMIGVLAGAQDVSPMAAEEIERLDALRIRQAKSIDGYPLIRLACHACPGGDMTIVVVGT
jgi:hypothetical protein